MAASNNEQQSSLSPHAPDFVPFGDLSGPGVPGGPAPVDSIGRLGVALMQGGQICAMFILLVLGRINIAVLGLIIKHSSQQEAIILAGLLDDALNRGG